MSGTINNNAKNNNNTQPLSSNQPSLVNPTQGKVSSYINSESGMNTIVTAKISKESANKKTDLNKFHMIDLNKTFTTKSDNLFNFGNIALNKRSKINNNSDSINENNNSKSTEPNVNLAPSKTQFINLITPESLSDDVERAIVTYILENPTEENFTITRANHTLIVRKDQNNVNEYKIEIRKGKLGQGGFGDIWAVSTASSPDTQQATKITYGPGALTLKNEIRILNTIDNKLKAIFKLSNADVGFQHAYRSQNVYNFTLNNREYTAAKMLKYTGDCNQLMKKTSRITDNQRIKSSKDFVNAAYMMRILGIIHKDLKPSNIFYLADQDQSVKIFISDFGSARTQKELVQEIAERPRQVYSDCSDKEYLQGEVTAALVPNADFRYMLAAWMLAMNASLEYSDWTPNSERRAKLLENDVKPYLVRQEKLDDFTIGVCLYYFLVGEMPYTPGYCGPRKALPEATWTALERYDDNTVAIVKGLLSIGELDRSIGDVNASSVGEEIKNGENRLSIRDIHKQWNPTLKK